MALNLTSRTAVLQAIAEFDRLGRDEFLSKYDFGEAREYFLYFTGRRYDSKAIAGVAHGYQHPSEGPLPASAFSGGERTVQAVLESLGFTVIKHASGREVPEALVLVENEVTAGGEYDFWADDTGARYHFPNQYRNRVRSGCRFVYYRGVRRKEKRRGAAEYFGTGVVGDIWLDPLQPTDTAPRARRWYCAIEEYEEFPTPVPFKRNGKPFENIETSMGWRTGVREISTDVLEEILAAAGANPSVVREKEAALGGIQFDEVPVSDLVISRPPIVKANVGGTGRRWERRTKEIGDWAEEHVCNWLDLTLALNERDTVDWAAKRGETPGWDISYISAAGAQVSVEVKATTAARFSAIDITANEWRAAGERGEHYVLVLVTKALTARPRIARLWNPASSAAAGEMQIVPMSFRLTLSKTA